MEQSPPGAGRGRLILLHGLEGSHQSGYMRSMAQTALEAGFHVTRLNMRTCGGTESRCKTLYHAGLTSDLGWIVDQYAAHGREPLFLAGFSLGGNVVLKLSGERGDSLPVSGVIAISTPIDLGACCRQMMRRENRLYEWRFIDRLKDRYRRRCLDHPDLYRRDGIDAVRSVYEFDDRFTAQHFGFGSADRYYETQSSQGYIEGMRRPALVIQAEDDPLIPFAVYERSGIRKHPRVDLWATRHGGHVGFISRRQPRFWADHAVLDWLTSRVPARSTVPLGRRPTPGH
jgi:predicted alpha/beta-fold hydrolase